MSTKKDGKMLGNEAASVAEGTGDAEPERT